MRAWASPLVVLLAAGCAVAPQTAVRPPAVAPPAAASLPGRTQDSFVQSYRKGVDEQSATLEAAGLGAELAAVRRHVAAHFPPDNEHQASDANAAELRASRIQSTANMLVQSGYRGAHFADPVQARRLVQAAASFDEDQTAIVAPTVALADLVRVDQRPDGSADLIYRIVEPMKNSPPAGRHIRVEMRPPAPTSEPAGTPPPPVPGEEEWGRPGRYVLFLSQPLAVLKAGGPVPADRYARFSTPRPVETAGTVRPGYHSGETDTTLERLRATIRDQVCAEGHVLVGSAPESSPGC